MLIHGTRAIDQFRRFTLRDQLENMERGMLAFNQRLQNMPMRCLDLTLIVDPAAQGASIAKGMVSSVAKNLCEHLTRVRPNRYSRKSAIFFLRAIS